MTRILAENADYLTDELTEAVQQITDTSFWQTQWDQFTTQFMAFLPRLVTAILIFVIGQLLVKLIMKIVNQALTKNKHTDAIIQQFLSSVLKIALQILILIFVLDVFGVPVSSFVTLISAVTLALSLAVKDSLANFAQGIIMMFTKPFTVGDYVETSGVAGTVQSISLFYTRLNTPDNVGIFIPNGDMAKAKVLNYSAEQLRRLELKFSIGYTDDFEKAKDIIRRIIDSHPYALQTPEPFVRVSNHGDSAIEITARIWVENAHYWELNFDMKEQVKKAFDDNGISIPFNQLDIHIVDPVRSE
ncbi:MAG TPA: mechanosensitive ion channel family protein [Firmicutes bacterium]|nr:mechanosensitive ion channel family protein [Bacillota bacterium]